MLNKNQWGIGANWEHVGLAHRSQGFESLILHQMDFVINPARRGLSVQVRFDPQSLAPVVELADTPDSKSGSFGSPGSNPGGSTKRTADSVGEVYGRFDSCSS